MWIIRIPATSITDASSCSFPLVILQEMHGQKRRGMALVCIRERHWIPSLFKGPLASHGNWFIRFYCFNVLAFLSFKATLRTQSKKIDQRILVWVTIWQEGDSSGKTFAMIQYSNQINKTTTAWLSQDRVGGRKRNRVQRVRQWDWRALFILGTSATLKKSHMETQTKD